jgi:hypothetical protein
MIVRFLNWLFAPRTCQDRGCGDAVYSHHDDRCAICRLRIR